MSTNWSVLTRNLALFEIVEGFSDFGFPPFLFLWRWFLNILLRQKLINLCNYFWVGAIVGKFLIYTLVVELGTWQNQCLFRVSSSSFLARGEGRSDIIVGDLKVDAIFRVCADINVCVITGGFFVVIKDGK